jgi:hypothetical protein
MIRKKRKSGGDEVKLGRSSSPCVITSPSTYETVRTEDGTTDQDDDDVIGRQQIFILSGRSLDHLSWMEACALAGISWDVAMLGALLAR